MTQFCFHIYFNYICDFLYRAVERYVYHLAVIISSSTTRPVYLVSTRKKISPACRQCLRGRLRSLSTCMLCACQLGCSRHPVPALCRPQSSGSECCDRMARAVSDPKRNRGCRIKKSLASAIADFRRSRIGIATIWGQPPHTAPPPKSRVAAAGNSAAICSSGEIPTARSREHGRHGRKGFDMDFSDV